MVQCAQHMQADDDSEHRGEYAVDVAHRVADGGARGGEWRQCDEAEQAHGIAARRSIDPAEQWNRDQQRIQYDMRHMRGKTKWASDGIGQRWRRMSPAPDQANCHDS